MISGRIRQLRNLSIEERRLLLAALALLPLVAISLRLFGYRRTHSQMARLNGSVPLNSLPKAEQPGLTGQVARMVAVAASHGPYSANCLRKSLIIWWLLGRKGIRSEIRIGAQKDHSGLRAHAWVEHEGKVLNDRQDIAEQFAPFESLIFPESIQFL